MSESMSNPWIRDYLIDVAETYGAQLYNAPIVSSSRKKVQLTDFLTYQENSYVWAWISDKDYRVSVRISKDAVGAYKSQYSRNIIDCRFAIVVISSYRPMFCPRPLGPYTTGNSPVSHLSLEVDQVRLIGIGGHLFGDPRDLESEENLKEWARGLRQDGGGGNVLKLRKQESLHKKNAAPSAPSPPPLSSHAPALQCQATKAPKDIVKPKPERPPDLKRVLSKRWRKIEADSWKFVSMLEAEERRKPDPHPNTPNRTPSPTSMPQQQGTPTDWSLSDRGSPVPVTSTALNNGTRQHDEEVPPATPCRLSDAEGHTTVNTALISDSSSVQPPTPAQRARHSPCLAFASPPPSEQLPCSFPLPPSSPLSLPSPALPIPLSIRKNIQRKVPHPGLPVARPDPANQGPAQILVPNSDTSGTGSSQLCSQSQHPSQSQLSQRQSSSHLPAFPSSLANDFDPLDASTPRDAKPNSSIRRTSRMSAEFPPTRCDTDNQETTSKGDQYHTEDLVGSIEKLEEPDSTRPVPSAPKTEVFEVGTSDTEEETEQLQLARNAIDQEAGLDRRVGARDTEEGHAEVVHKYDPISADKGEVPTSPRSSPPCPSACLPATSIMQYSASNGQNTGDPVQHSLQSPERAGSRSSMHSLFTNPSDDEQLVSSHVPMLAIDRKEGKVQGKMSPARVPSHNPEAWREPSFLARSQGKDKARAVERRPGISGEKVGKKRQSPTQPESPVPKRAKVTVPEVRQAVAGRTIAETVRCQDAEVSASKSNRPSTSPKDTTETATTSTTPQSSRPRLASFVVDFKRVDLGKRVPIPTVDPEKHLKGTSLRTGRIRALGEEDGDVYILE